MSPPTLVYDDDCGICTRAAEFVDRHATIEIVGFSQLNADIRASLPDEFESCAHLITTEGVYSCGEAMERAYALTGYPPSSLFPAFRHVPGYSILREWVYRLVANNRPLIGRLLS